MKTTIPFTGFYCSEHDAALDDALEQMFDDNADLMYRAHNVVNWAWVHNQYAREYVKAWASANDVNSLTFCELVSPREYNFSTDVIACEIPIEEVRRIRKRVGERRLQEVATELFTSRPGFHSFYSPYLADWGPLEKWDHNQVGALMKALPEEASMEDAQCNGRLEEWLIQHNPKIERLLKVHDYLTARKERGIKP